MEELISLNEVLRFAQRRRRAILEGIAATVVGVLVLTFLTTPTYEATALLLVKFGREYVYRPEVADQQSASNPVRDRQAFINTELQILRSKDLAATVVSTVGVNKLYPKISDQERPKQTRLLMAAALAFSANFTAESITESDVIRVTFHHSDPQMTAQALNLLVDQFKEKHLQVFSDPQAAAFLEEKVIQYREDLDSVEQKLKALQLDTKSFSIDDQRSGLFQQRRDLEAALKETSTRVDGLMDKRTYLRSEKEKAQADTGRMASEQNKAISDARAQLLELELQENRLLAKFNENSRNVVSVREQIRLVKNFLETQKAAIGQGEFADDLEKQIVAVVAELRFQEARLASLRGQLAQLEKDLGRVPEQAAQYRDLVRQREAAEKTLQTYVKKLEEARSSQDMDREKIANISVIQSATVPLTPAWPKKGLSLLLGILLGTIVGVAWAFVVDRRAERGRTEPDEAEGTARSLMTQPEETSTTGDDRGSAIGLDQVGGAPSPVTQFLGGDRDAARAGEQVARGRLEESREETEIVGPRTAAAAAARARLEEAGEASEPVLSLEPGDAKTPQEASRIEAQLAHTDLDLRWEPAGTAVLNWRSAPDSPDADAPEESLAQDSGAATVGGLALATRWKGHSRLSVERLALATKWKASRLLTLARKAPKDGDRGSAIALDQAYLDPAPPTQALNRDRGAVTGEEAADERLGEAPEESERKISLEPGEGERQRVASDTESEARLPQQDREHKKKRRRRTKKKGNFEPAATVAFSSRQAPETPEAATPAAPDESVAPALSEAPVERPALAAKRTAWAIALVVLAGGGLLSAVLLGVTPPWNALRQAPMPRTIEPVTPTRLTSEGARGLDEPRPVDMQEPAKVAVPRVRPLEQKQPAPEGEKKAAQQKASENPEKKLEAPVKARGQVMDPAALARAQEDERMKARADEERKQQDEMRRLEESTKAEETRVAEERRRTEEARVVQEAARTAAARSATLPPSTAPPEPAVKPGQLVSLSETGVIAPIVKSALKPSYPPRALRQKVEGTVELIVLVDETGKVVDTQVVTAAGGNSGLNEAAVALVKKSMFHMATKDGVPVKVWVPLKIEYRLPR